MGRKLFHVKRVHTCGFSVDSILFHVKQPPYHIRFTIVTAAHARIASCTAFHKQHFHPRRIRQSFHVERCRFTLFFSRPRPNFHVTRRNSAAQATGQLGRGDAPHGTLEAPWLLWNNHRGSTWNLLFLDIPNQFDALFAFQRQNEEGNSKIAHSDASFVVTPTLLPSLFRPKDTDATTVAPKSAPATPNAATFALRRGPGPRSTVKFGAPTIRPTPPIPKTT